MDKILILGNSGSGKSTFGKQLSVKLDIPLLFLDPLVYEYNWKDPNYPQMSSYVNDFIKNDKYIIDGNFLDQANERFDDCDTIIFLDINPFICLRSVIERKRMYKGKNRESRSSKVDERIDFSYLRWVLYGFNLRSKPKIKRIIKEHSNKNIIILKSRKKMTEFINNLED